MKTSIEHFIENSLIEICQNAGNDFSGLGIIYYKDLSHLPYISLHDANLPFDLITENLSKTLLTVSKYSSIYHDGFHFINIDTLHITHISQFISPPLESVTNISIDQVIPCGAREMTAFLTSNIEGVFCVGLISANKTIKIFKNSSTIYQQVST
ncbi:hypothetical protein [Acinetobacter genomosp. 15BJ]|uniref:Uncharacterized protein n=1 Tax=Acinetobacter genomosp. 15BJ TaxID=106651 RepID=A0ABT8V4F3_9GAMM|nr:hypothetical protein [Acinetobacter genomosp. 15BJ]MDO3659211.1 hypothetical protein [Acinetobacter genomosp. 15BJ]